MACITPHTPMLSRYAEVKEKMPEEFAARARDKYNYRYPRGESYDVRASWSFVCLSCLVSGGRS